MMRYLALVLALILADLPHNAAKAKDQLVIGITQFPSTFHPNIDSMLAKSYILAMTRRPFTVYDVNWRTICLLCTKRKCLVIIGKTEMIKHHFLSNIVGSGILQDFQLRIEQI